MIDFNNVTYKIKNKVILDKISFSIKEQEKVLIVGKSGSGKTSLFNLIAKHIKANSGDILVDGININKLNHFSLQEYRRNTLSMILQSDNLINSKTVLENLLIYYKYDDVINMLNKTKLTYLKDRKVEILSGGERQRIEIIQELLANKKIILADEITSALDIKNAKEIIDFILTYFNDKTIIFISHDTNLFNDFIDRIITIDNGKLIANVVVKNTIKTRYNQVKVNKNKEIYIVNKVIGKSFSISFYIVYLMLILCLFISFNFKDICNYLAKLSYQKYFNYDVLSIENNVDLISDNQSIFIDISDELEKSLITINDIDVINKTILPFNNKDDYSSIVVNKKLLDRLSIDVVKEVNIFHNDKFYKFIDIDIIEEDNTFTYPTIYYDFRYFNKLINVSTDKLIYVSDNYDFDDRFTNNPMYSKLKEDKPYLDSYAYQDYLTYLMIFDSLKSIVDYYLTIIIFYCITTSILINFSLIIKDKKKVAILISKGIKDKFILLHYMIPLFVFSFVFLFFKSITLIVLLSLSIQILTIMISYYLVKRNSLYKLLKEEYLS